MKLSQISNMFVDRFGSRKARNFFSESFESYEFSKTFQLFCRLNKFAKNLTSLKLFNLFHKSNQLGKKINFFKQHIQAMKLCDLFRAISVTPNWSTNCWNIFKHANRAKQLWKVSSYAINWINSQEASS